MPIEIRELVIRTHITEERSKGHTEKTQPHINEREIIDRCMESIFKKLYRKSER